MDIMQGALWLIISKESLTLSDCLLTFINRVFPASVIITTVLENQCLKSEGINVIRYF